MPVNKTIDGVIKKQKIHIHRTTSSRKFTILASEPKFGPIIIIRHKKNSWLSVLRHLLTFDVRWIKTALLPQYVIPVIIGIALSSFVGGAAFALRTPRSQADAQQQTFVSPNTPLGAATPTPATVPPAGLFTTPIQLLQSYFSGSTAPDQIAVRAQAIEAFLSERHSPLAADSETIAEQPHWKLILAISFAESTLGRNCYEFNCSGIGGSNIKTYRNFKNWIIDFNQLLEHRYNNSTLQQMCGVYVQPCTQNWLNATQEILEQITRANIN